MRLQTFTFPYPLLMNLVNSVRHVAGCCESPSSGSGCGSGSLSFLSQVLDSHSQESSHILALRPPTMLSIPVPLSYCDLSRHPAKNSRFEPGRVSAIWVISLSAKRPIDNPKNLGPCSLPCTYRVYTVRSAPRIRLSWWTLLSGCAEAQLDSIAIGQMAVGRISDFTADSCSARLAFVRRGSQYRSRTAGPGGPGPDTPGDGRPDMATTKTERDAILAGWQKAAPEGTALLDVDGATQPIMLERRTFSSGSVGFYAQGKVVGEDGRRYQLGVTLTLIGSKPSA